MLGSCRQNLRCFKKYYPHLREIIRYNETSSTDEEFSIPEYEPFKNGNTSDFIKLMYHEMLSLPDPEQHVSTFMHSPSSDLI